jgi:hypothetical protein
MVGLHTIPAVDMTYYIGLVVAALAHDVGHFGVNNAFCLESFLPIAIIYNDNAPLENMHCALLFMLMGQLGDDHNMFGATWHDTDLKSFRKIVVELILATDMSKHFTTLKELKAAVSETMVMTERATILLCLSMVIKASDLGHSCKPWTQHEEWSRRVAEEFFRQGDMEREQGRAPSALNDRETVILPKGQQGFLDFLCIPLFVEVTNVANHLHPDEPSFGESCDTLVNTCKSNKECWSGMLEEWDNSLPVWYQGWPGDKVSDTQVKLQSSFGFKSPDDEFVSNDQIHWLGVTEKDIKLYAGKF